LTAVAGAFAVIIVALPATGRDAFAAQSEADLDLGRQIYEQSCQSCHQPGGAGIVGTFPPLAGNPAAADAPFVRESIMSGRSGEIVVLGVTYNGQMPAIDLDAQQLDAVVAYVGSLAGSDTPTPTTVPQGAPAGDQGAGEALFTGTTRLSNGAVACFACHQAGAHGNAGLGLGPDLSSVSTRLGGAAGLQTWLAAPPSPTMQPIFTDHPLTDGEVADLVAYLDSIEAEAPAGIDPLAIGGLVGLALLIAFMALVLKGPRQSYAEQLRSRS
jgi:mono/diheme cytochrome c family protein